MEMDPDPIEIEYRLQEFLRRHPGYHIQQRNGQRVYEMIEWPGLEPQRPTEAFIYNIPRNVFEDYLIPLFEPFGTIYNFRMMMDFSGTNRGYAYIRYSNPREMTMAVVAMNEVEILPGHRIGVKQSLDRRRLFLKPIPNHLNKIQLQMDLEGLTPNIKHIFVKQCSVGRNLAFAVVEYLTHHDAAVAKKRLMADETLWGGCIKRVEWARGKKK